MLTPLLPRGVLIPEGLTPGPWQTWLQLGESGVPLRLEVPSETLRGAGLPKILYYSSLLGVHVPGSMPFLSLS